MRRTYTYMSYLVYFKAKSYLNSAKYVMRLFKNRLILNTKGNKIEF